ncbi:MAG: methionyl-tRNA formyltransferase [Cyanobacteria bacterium]|nr:methionyl-tRNA formyltransferase [Cyanobacteriota bacterium]
MIRLIFLGTPAFSVSTLDALFQHPEIEVLGVITQPDKPSGRGHKLQPTAVKAFTESLDTNKIPPIFQPKSIRKDTNLLNWIREQKPDFLVTIAFGQILSQEVLDIPTLGTVNVHASLLPELRGANPIQWAILQNKNETGLTTMLTDIGVDTGDMLFTQKVPISPEDTTLTLADKLSKEAGPLLIDTLFALKNKTIQTIPQNHDQATHAPKRKAEDALIDWNMSAHDLHNLIRAQQPWPGAITYWNQERIKLFQCKPFDLTSIEPDVTSQPGSIISLEKEGMMVQTGSGVLLIKTLQPPGKKEMNARDWANGALKQKPYPPFHQGALATSSPTVLPIQ